MINIAELSLTLDNLRKTIIDEIGRILHQFDCPTISCKTYAELTPSYRKPKLVIGDTLLWIANIEDTDCGIILTDDDGHEFPINGLTTDELLSLLINLNSVWGTK